MRQAIVTVNDRDGTALGLGGLIETFENAGLRDLEILSCEGGRGVTRVTVAEPVHESTLEEMDAIVWWERAKVSGADHAYVLEFDVAQADNMIDACDEDLLLCGTIDMAGEGFTFDVAGPQDAIRETIDEYENAGASVSLETLRDFEPQGGPMEDLTPRQREIVETAYEEGYFDVPREATTQEVADAVGLDDSTVAEHLQRAERNLVTSVLAVSE